MGYSEAANGRLRSPIRGTEMVPLAHIASHVLTIFRDRLPSPTAFPASCAADACEETIIFQRSPVCGGLV